MRKMKFRALARIMGDYSHNPKKRVVYWEMGDNFDDDLLVKEMVDVDFKTVEGCIGLKDKNKKDIYEEDIVEWTEYTHKKSKMLKNRWHKLVKDYKEDDCVGEKWGDYKIRDVVRLTVPRLWLKEEYFGYEGEGLTDPKDCEVIGNTRENSKLLKK